MKENQRIAVTRRMLKEGLLRLLETKTLDKIRISELCEESSINRATFYRHYVTVQDVLVELETDFVKQMIPNAVPSKDEAETRRRMESACAYLYDHRDIARILFRNNTDRDVVARLNDLYRQFWDLRKKEGSFSDVDDDTARIVISLLGGGSYCLLRQWIMEDIPKTPQEIASIVCSIINWPDPTDLT